MSSSNRSHLSGISRGNTVPDRYMSDICTVILQNLSNVIDDNSSYLVAKVGL